MAASLVEAGFQVWDVTMQDLLSNQITLDKFRGIIFPGGFSYAGNVVILFLKKVSKVDKIFYPDALSFQTYLDQPKAGLLVFSSTLL